MNTTTNANAIETTTTVRRVARECAEGWLETCPDMRIPAGTEYATWRQEAGQGVPAKGDYDFLKTAMGELVGREPTDEERALFEGEMLRQLFELTPAGEVELPARAYPATPARPAIAPRRAFGVHEAPRHPRRPFRQHHAARIRARRSRLRRASHRAGARPRHRDGGHRRRMRRLRHGPRRARRPRGVARVPGQTRRRPLQSLLRRALSAGGNHRPRVTLSSNEPG